jgi:hypothetical protein
MIRWLSPEDRWNEPQNDSLGPHLTPEIYDPFESLKHLLL